MSRHAKRTTIKADDIRVLEQLEAAEQSGCTVHAVSEPNSQRKRSADGDGVPKSAPPPKRVRGKKAA